MERRCIETCAMQIVRVFSLSFMRLATERIERFSI
jgi:hypothetical protein